MNRIGDVRALTSVSIVAPILTAALLSGMPAATPPATPSSVTTQAFPSGSGSIKVSAGDLFVLHADGDLWLHPGLLGPDPGQPMRLIDNADPRQPVAEGPGPNVIVSVTGPANGVVFAADCCEPVSGNLLAVTTADSAPASVGFAQAAKLDPGGTRLGLGLFGGWGVADLAKNSSKIATAELMMDGALDIAWTADGSALAVIYSDGQGSRLRLVDPDTLALKSSPDNEPVFGVQAQFAGRSPDGSLLVTLAGQGPTEVRAYQPAGLTENTGQLRVFPASVTSVRATADGTGLLWVDGTALMYESGGSDLRQLLDGVANVWTPGG